MTCAVNQGVVFCQSDPWGFTAGVLLLVVVGYALARLHMWAVQRS